MTVYISTMESAYIWPLPCIFMRWSWLMFGICNMYVCAMELAYIWQWLCLFPRWGQPMFGNKNVCLCDGNGLFLANACI